MPLRSGATRLLVVVAGAGRKTDAPSRLGAFAAAATVARELVATLGGCLATLALWLAQDQAATTAAFIAGQRFAAFVGGDAALSLRFTENEATATAAFIARQRFTTFVA